MSKLLNSKTLKVGGLFIAIAMMLTVAGAVASAQTTTTTTTVVASGYTYSGVMKVGMSGPGISTLQAALNEVNAGTTIVVDGKFGPATKAAVMKFQMSKGLVADGVVGPKTGAALAAATVAVITVPTSGLPAGCTSTSGFSSTTGVRCDSGSTLPAGCTSTAGFSPTTGAKCSGGSTSGGGSTSSGPLEGGAGSITVDDKSTYSNEEVTSGDEDEPVLAFEIEADDESDVEITSVKVEFVESGATSSNDLEDYAESVSVWMNGDMIGEADVEEFTENNDVWTKTISLDGAIIRAGEMEDLVIGVTALNNLDSGDIDSDAWTVDVVNVRFEDGEGVVTTEDTDDISGTPDLEKTFDFEDLSTSGDLELKLTEGDENPDAMAVEISDSSSTDEVVMLAFNLKAEGSDMVIDSMKMDVSSTGNTDGVDEIVEEFALYHGDEEIDSVSAPTGATGQIVFDDLDLTIEENDTEEFWVKANIMEVCVNTDAACDTGGERDAAFSQGDSVTVSFTGANLDDETNTDVEDSEGDTVVAADRTGGVTGDAQSFYSDGMIVTPGNHTAVAVPVDGAADYGTYTIKFTVEAFGQDVYLDKTFASSQSQSTTPTGNGRVAVENSAGTALAGGFSAALSSNDNDAEEKTNTYKIDEGSSAEFTLTVNATGTNANQRAILYALEWGSTDAATGTEVYISNMGVDGDYKTNYIYVSSV